ncbi:MAG: hypothetical protein JW809_11090 [Pirellulales bacterium]|nr:hypothetical protein [Pirellulales bacterium]
MKNRFREDDSGAGQDSFLDILTNIVGVIIILMLVVAVRAKNAPLTLSVPSPSQQAARKDLDVDLATERSLHNNVLEVAAQIETVAQTRRLRWAERAQLSLAVARIEQELLNRRDKLDAQAQADFDQRRALDDAQARLTELNRQLQNVARTPPTSVRVESYPTPLSKIVNGQELHLQLRGGRLTVVPLDALVEELKAVFQQKAPRMDRDSELNGQLGPIGGFRLLYTLRRYDASMRQYEQTGQGGSIVRVEEFELRPISEDLGEPLEAALREGSALRRELANRNPARTTVTVWTYPDGFDAFRQLKKDLFHRGFATAARPLPEGKFIGGSPDGRRSAAQ